MGDWISRQKQGPWFHEVEKLVRRARGKGIAGNSTGEERRQWVKHGIQAKVDQGLIKPKPPSRDVNMVIEILIQGW